ncbi:MAG TPA: hypothetical protein DD672_13345 [Gammaproteobacteria bacterium]|jgi:bacteriocin-like protein|nr:hypothetical protein [Gammaproteobacteria bacterium]OUX34027.1 MAG: hypothetical protein CBE20_03005 [Gammaproteobacteria bacterium TMED260]HBQ01449.1 hypothetical protein [Gammaproteobacteria bacterium]
MRELTEKEMESIAGGGYIADMAAEWGAIGTVVGYVADTTIAGATRGGFTGAMLGTSYAIGYSAGSYVYDRYQDS